jgi:hypothetical protein
MTATTKTAAAEAGSTTGNRATCMAFAGASGNRKGGVWARVACVSARRTLLVGNHEPLMLRFAAVHVRIVRHVLVLADEPRQNAKGVHVSTLVVSRALSKHFGRDVAGRSDKTCPIEIDRRQHNTGDSSNSDRGRDRDRSGGSAHNTNKPLPHQHYSG